MIAGPSNEPWVRWTSKGGTAYAIVDAAGSATLPVGDVNRLDLTKAELLGTGPLAAEAAGGGVAVELPPAGVAPVVVSFALLD